MIVVSDTSPISNLMTIGELEILKSIFKKIIIPEGVKRELEVIDKHRISLRNNEWISIQKIKDQKLLSELLETLDQGESEAIVLALEKQADYLLIDERKGRRIALKYGLKITGLLGVLSTAKHKGIIDQVAPYIDKLMLVSGFRIGVKLRNQILRDLKEL
ncbi:MAG: DUF3368 domain-containing protein [Bacteroidota bacterium]